MYLCSFWQILNTFCSSFWVMRVTKVLLLEWAPPPPRTQFDCEILRFFGTAQNHVGSNVVEMLKFLQFCPLSTIPGSKNFWSRNCAQFPKKVELCSIPVPWAQGILVSTGNRAQFQVELWMGIELKGRNCGWELSSRDSRNLRHLSARVSMAITTVYCEKRGNHVITRDGNWAQFPSGNQA